VDLFTVLFITILMTGFVMFVGYKFKGLQGLFSSGFIFILLALITWWCANHFVYDNQSIQEHRAIKEDNTTYYINTGIKTEVNTSEVGFRASIAIITQNYGDYPMKTENGVLFVTKAFAENVDKRILEKAVREYEASVGDKDKKLKSYGE